MHYSKTSNQMRSKRGIQNSDFPLQWLYVAILNVLHKIQYDTRHR
ncbi:Uncharacterised protein [Streptococcus pneumoniae]|nr:Uncharacterised protein [Streptococcus pneumoniae]